MDKICFVCSKTRMFPVHYEPVSRQLRVWRDNSCVVPNSDGAALAPPPTIISTENRQNWEIAETNYQKCSVLTAVVGCCPQANWDIPASGEYGQSWQWALGLVWPGPVGPECESIITICVMISNQEDRLWQEILALTSGMVKEKFI